MIYITSDHAGFELKQHIIAFLKNSKKEFLDLSPEYIESDDYPVKAIKLAKTLKNKPESLGIAICGTGIGMSIVLNRFSGIFAANLNNREEVELFKKHNHGNVLCLAGRFLDPDIALELINSFIETPFDLSQRHVRRLKQIP